MSTCVNGATRGRWRGACAGSLSFALLHPVKILHMCIRKSNIWKKAPFYSIHDSFSVRFIPNFFFESVFLPRKNFGQKFLDKKNCAYLSTLIVEAWEPHPVFCFNYILKKVFLYKVFCFYVKSSKVKRICCFFKKNFWQVFFVPLKGIRRYFTFLSVITEFKIFQGRRKVKMLDFYYQFFFQFSHKENWIWRQFFNC